MICLQSLLSDHDMLSITLRDMNALPRDLHAFYKFKIKYYYYPHCIHGETESQKGKVNLPK